VLSVKLNRRFTGMSGIQMLIEKDNTIAGIIQK
jgi:hypothetical protein